MLRRKLLVLILLTSGLVNLDVLGAPVLRSFAKVGIRATRASEFKALQVLVQKQSTDIAELAKVAKQYNKLQEAISQDPWLPLKIMGSAGIIGGVIMCGTYYSLEKYDKTVRPSHDLKISKLMRLNY